MRYWIRVDGQTRGPFAPEEIGRLPYAQPDALVCPEGSAGGADWKRLKEVSELHAALPLMSPAAQTPAPRPKELGAPLPAGGAIPPTASQTRPPRPKGVSAIAVFYIAVGALQALAGLALMLVGLIYHGPIKTGPTITLGLSQIASGAIVIFIGKMWRDAKKWTWYLNVVLWSLGALVFAFSLLESFGALRLADAALDALMLGYALTPAARGYFRIGQAGYRAAKQFP